LQVSFRPNAKGLRKLVRALDGAFETNAVHGRAVACITTATVIGSELRSNTTVEVIVTRFADSTVVTMRLCGVSSELPDEQRRLLDREAIRWSSVNSAGDRRICFELALPPEPLPVPEQPRVLARVPA
jgi:hypothetical protein